MMLKRLLIVLLLFAVAPACFSQNNINGTWEGKFLLDEFDLGQPKLVVEIYDFKDSLFTGVTHLYYRGNKYEHYKMIGWYDKKDSLLVFREASTIAVDLGIYGNCLGTYMMSLSKENNYLFQYGYWVPNIKGCTSNVSVWLRKKIEEKIVVPEVKPVEKKPVIANKPPVKDKPVVNKPVAPVVTIPDKPVAKEVPQIKTSPVILPAKISERQTDIQSLLEIDPSEKDSIKIDVYDNGDIDGDSVSVYLEEKQLINKKMITAKPLTIYVSLDKRINPIAHLRMVAESLGSIPPCTALMIVTTKTKRYEVRLSSNFNKNATVELFLKE
ncbi:hypothetical protein [Ferruginibacter sp.]